MPAKWTLLEEIPVGDRTKEDLWDHFQEALESVEQKYPQFRDINFLVIAGMACIYGIPR